jgi:hypothetical protein
MPIVTAIHITEDIYSPIDEGCSRATAYLGYQTQCKQCPFTQCAHDKRYSGRFYQRWTMSLEDWKIQLRKRGLVCQP